MKYRIVTCGWVLVEVKHRMQKVRIMRIRRLSCSPIWAKSVLSANSNKIMPYCNICFETKSCLNFLAINDSLGWGGVTKQFGNFNMLYAEDDLQNVFLNPVLDMPNFQVIDQA